MVYPVINSVIEDGVVCVSNTDGNFLLVNREPGSKYLVRFIGTGNQYIRAISSIKTGLVKDTNKDRTPEFVEKAKAIHGDTYDYSITLFKTVKSKVKILCKKHGEIEINPEVHLKGGGCKLCGYLARDEKQRMHEDEFIEVFNNLNSSFTYVQGTFKKYTEKCVFKCQNHGEFSTTPASVLSSGSGCPSCGNKARGEALTQDFETFVKRATVVHGTFYTYHKEFYTKISSKTKITCPLHGDFFTKPYQHLDGVRCPRCAIELNADKTRKTLEQFLEDALNTHGDRYDYSLVNYTGTLNKVVIRCKTHGEFRQTPSSHIRGQGCPSCTLMGYKESKPSYLYVLDDGEFFKIGKTNNEPTTRLKQINKTSPRNFNIVYSISFDGGCCSFVEKRVHNWLIEIGCSRPKEKFDGSTECFSGSNLGDIVIKINEFGSEYGN